ncbi:MAG: hypothetical protein WEH44_01270, partial [Pirellulaceae bacterium]
GVAAGAAPMPRTQPLTPAAGALSLTIRPITQIEVGKRAVVQFDLFNSGTTPITNVELLIEHPASLGPTQASPDAEQGDTSVMWGIDSIGPRQTASRQIEFEGLEADPLAKVRALVVSDQSAEQSKEATIRVVAPAITPPMGGAAGPMGAKAGPAAPPATNANNLKISGADTPDPVKAGAEVTYLIDVTNAGAQADSDVVLSFTLPAGFAIKTFSEATGKLRMQSVGAFGSARYELTPIAALKSGEKHSQLTLKATAGGAGKGTLKITTTSRLNPRGIETTVETTVLP